MKNTLFPFILIIMLTSCSRPTQTEQELRNTINKKLHLEMFEMVRQGNTFLSLDELRQQYEFLSVVYLQNGCQPCYPKFIEWQHMMDSVGCPANHTVLFVIGGNSYENFMTEVLNIEYIADHYYNIMDPEFGLLSQNSSIPQWIINSSVLIDSENKIKMVGAPWINEDMKNLFYETVKNEQ